jgi:ATP-dependent DNA ligase
VGATEEVKLDGFRLEVIKDRGQVTLYSRNGNVLNKKFPYIAEALMGLPDGTILDGELVALDKEGKPNFGLLQNFRSAASRIHFYPFDILIQKRKNLMGSTLGERRAALHCLIVPSAHVSLSVVTQGSADEMLRMVKNHGLEGVVAKRVDGVYQPGKRTGLWAKHRINLGQEFVIGGYTPGSHGIDAIIVGFYRGKELIYAARVRAGFVPATRRKVFDEIKGLKTTKCPFANLPELSDGRWGAGLTAAKMKDCVWLLCRIRHSSHYVECRTMPHGCGRSCHHCI